jgi:hypothetical protein
LVRQSQPLRFVEDPKQILQGGVARLRALPVDADLGQSVGVRREFEPGGPAGGLYGVGPAAHDQMRIQARHLVPELVQLGDRHLDARTAYPDGSRDSIPVNAVFVLEGYQNARLSFSFQGAFSRELKACSRESALG